MTDREEKKQTGTGLEDSFSTDNGPTLLEEAEDTVAESAAVSPVVDDSFSFDPISFATSEEDNTPLPHDDNDVTVTDTPVPSEGPLASEETPVDAPADASSEALAAALSTPIMAQEEKPLPLEREEEEESENLYTRILEVLSKAGDLGIDAVAKGHIMEALQGDELPQLACRHLVTKRVINKVQLARAVARAQHHIEITSFLDLPADAAQMRQSLPDPVLTLLRERRIIPLKEEILKDGSRILDLAHEGAVKDLVLESTLQELLNNYTFRWHFCMREVAGAYWLSGANEDVDTGMEAEALLDRIIGNAIDARSSDIHIDPSIRGEPRAIVKYRVDGAVMPKEVITTEQLDRLRVRIENLARMPKVNHSHPNKGSFTRAGFDWRVQVQPHSGPHGTVPRIVLRQLKPDVMPMEALGYPEYFIEKIKLAAQAPNGVILWTGPTGSGKTESIHSAIVSVNPMAKGLSVHTIEDPPEKRVPGYALQMEAVEEDAPRNALSLLKSSLRADPDVIVFGEVRDKDMAKLVFEAANTGHLVFSTLHTNTALDAIVRLHELGIDGFLTSYIRGVAAQRLVRRLCVHCRQKVEEPDEYTQYVFDRYGLELEGANLYKANPQGCLSCNFKGYYGRIAVAEWLRPTKELVDLSSKGDFESLEDVARRAGWQPMGYMGVWHVKHGITDADELARTILELSGDLLV